MVPVKLKYGFRDEGRWTRKVMDKGMRKLEVASSFIFVGPPNSATPQPIPLPCLPNPLNMKPILLFLFTIISFSSFSQKVFSVQYQSQADVKLFVVQYESQADLKVYKVNYESQVSDNGGKWFFTDYESQAKKKVFFVDYESQADLKIFFIKYESQAGWVNANKKHLMY